MKECNLDSLELQRDALTREQAKSVLCMFACCVNSLVQCSTLSLPWMLLGWATYPCVDCCLCQAIFPTHLGYDDNCREYACFPYECSTLPNGNFCPDFCVPMAATVNHFLIFSRISRAKNGLNEEINALRNFSMQ